MGYIGRLVRPIDLTDGVYERIGASLTPDAEQRMRSYLEARPRERHGRHEYAFADTGLDREEMRARFAAYQNRYAVPSEI